jgi:hypothetical protein
MCIATERLPSLFNESTYHQGLLKNCVVQGIIRSELLLNNSVVQAIRCRRGDHPSRKCRTCCDFGDPASVVPGAFYAHKAILIKLISLAIKVTINA